MKTKIVRIECKSCKGTGLYQGFCEKEGCAVICTNCKGQGVSTETYIEFTGRNKLKGIERVFKTSGMFYHAPKNTFFEDDKVTIRFEDGGCTYDKWLNGAEPKPVKDLYCPYIWDRNSYPIKRCDGGMNTFSSKITDCKFQCDKLECWRLYEEKNEEGKE